MKRVTDLQPENDRKRSSTIDRFAARLQGKETSGTEPAGTSLDQHLTTARRPDQHQYHSRLLHRAATGDPSLPAQRLALQIQKDFGNRHFRKVVELARKGEASEVAAETEEAINRKRGSGRPLDGGVQTRMETAFGADFSGVQVHTDSQADRLSRDLHARAFTTGRDIFFREGDYNPGSASGRELLAHELTHVVQQTGGLQAKLAVSQPGDASEREADDVAASIMKSEQESDPQETGNEKIRRQPKEEDEGATAVQAKIAAPNDSRVRLPSIRLTPQPGAASPPTRAALRPTTLAIQCRRSLKEEYSGQFQTALTSLNNLYIGAGGLIDRQKDAIDYFKGHAGNPDPPSFTDQAIITAINLVIGAVLPGVGNILKAAAQQAIRPALKGAVGAIIDSMVVYGRGQAQAAVRDAWKSASGETRLLKFCEPQILALNDIGSRQMEEMNKKLAELQATEGQDDEWEAADALYQAFRQSLPQAYAQQFGRMTDVWFTEQVGIIGAGARPGILQIFLDRRYPDKGSFRLTGGNLIGEGSTDEIRSRLAQRPLQDIGIPKLIHMNGKMGGGIADCKWSIRITGELPRPSGPAISAPTPTAAKLLAGPQRVQEVRGHPSWGLPWLAAFHLGLQDLDNDDPRNSPGNQWAGAREIWEAIKEKKPGSIDDSTW